MDKFSYCVGVLVAQNLKSQGLDEVQSTDLATGIADVISGNSLKFSMEEANKILEEHMKAKAMKAYEKNVAEGQAFLENNAKKEGVTSLVSGLQYEVLTEGRGASPSSTDQVTTHYHGTLIDGQVFDSSVQRGQPATFPVNGVIQGWVEALQLMKVGSKWRLYVPHHLAYGDRGAGEMIKPFSTLIFDVELLKIN